MIKKLTYYSLGISSIIFPSIALAQAPRNLNELLDIFLNFFDAIVPLIFLLALIFFLWGAAKYILKSDDAGARAEGSKMMLYGIVALFVMVSIWGLVGILGGTFGVKTVIPSFQGDPGSSGFTDCIDDGGVAHC